MQRLCDDCHGVYKNKASFVAHQNKTGHQQHGIANNKDTNIAIGQEESEEGKLTPAELETANKLYKEKYLSKEWSLGGKT